MTKQENKIPIKGYATFHPLKHCLIGSGFQAEWFRDLPIYKNNKIMDPLRRIAEETEEDFETLEKILKEANIKTYRARLNMEKYGSLQNIYRPPMAPRDHFAVLGEKLYAVGGISEGYADVLKQIDRKNLIIEKAGLEPISTAHICRVGKDIWWDISNKMDKDLIEKYKTLWTEEGFRVHLSHRGHHTDAEFCVVKPGCIVSMYDVQDYKKEFPNWDVQYVADKSWDKLSSFMQMKDKVGGRWWLKGEEHNDELIHFVNTWLNDWVGFVEETVFDVNMLSLDENTIICNNYNKDVFDYFKKHKVEPIIFNPRHRFFWDGGIHCITQDLYREGTMEDYFG